MHCAFDLKLETEESKQEWLEIKKDPLQYMIQNIKMNQGAILLNIKRVFGVTPQSVRNMANEKALHIRPLVLWLLANKTRNDLEDTKQKFGIELSELEPYKDNDAIKERYKTEIERFFEPLVSSYLDNLYANMVFGEKIMQIIEKNDEDERDMLLGLLETITNIKEN